jgi:NADPH:quinone reductase-like Zn-dependent oxidoreductase
VRESPSDSRFKQGDVVFTASTDYRDLRKSAYQQVAVASSFNVARVPSAVSRERVAGLGVAFVAAVLALGVCLGCDFTEVGGPNPRRILKSMKPESIPADQREECLRGIEEEEAVKRGDWILIWGGSTTSAHVLSQLAKLIGLRVIKVVDVAKHGARLSQGSADLLVDNYDCTRATEIIRTVTDGKLRFAVDTIGSKTASLAQSCLGQDSHLVGLSGLPADGASGIKHHTVPIKIYHEVHEIGGSLMSWLETLLKHGQLSPPDIEVAPGALGGINDALDRMRRGEISGKRLVVKL